MDKFTSTLMGLLVLAFVFIAGAAVWGIVSAMWAYWYVGPITVATLLTAYQIGKHID